MIRMISAVVLFFLLVSCSSEKQEVIETSGDVQYDSTARYALYVVEELKKRSSLESPSDIVSYMTSTHGSAEFYPPSLEYEKDAAMYYKGPRPSDNVKIMKHGDKFPLFFSKQLVLQGDDENGIIVAEARTDSATTTVFRWEWSVVSGKD